jgi:hypothetical protein
LVIVTPNRNGTSTRSAWPPPALQPAITMATTSAALESFLRMVTSSGSQPGSSSVPRRTNQAFGEFQPWESPLLNEGRLPRNNETISWGMRVEQAVGSIESDCSGL